MRLVYLSLEAPRNGQASYTHIHEIIAGLRRRGWTVTLHQPSYTDKSTSPGLFRRLADSVRSQIGLWAHWQRGSVLYIRSHYLAFPSAVLARLFNIPVVHEINGPYEDAFITHPALHRIRRPLIWSQRLQYRWATCLIAVTVELCDWARQESNGKPVHLVSNGANTDLFKPGLPRPPGLPDRYVIFFGGLTAWHGVPVMIDAVNHPAWPADVHLVVIGDGNDMPLLRTAAASNRRIHILGKLNYIEVPPFVGSALAGLVPITNPQNRSRTGLFPLKLFETLACGIPAIVTDFPGQANMVRMFKCGVVIPAEDSVALAKAVAMLAGDAEAAQQMGKIGHNVIIREHSWDMRAEATHKILLNEGKNWLPEQDSNLRPID